MIEPWYIAVKPFGPSVGEKWTEYIQWSRLVQLKELVSFDNVLCPCVLTDLTEHDWDFNVNADFLIFFFTNFEYLVNRVSRIHPINLLAAVRNPCSECSNSLSDSRFEFKGYDVVDVCVDISALTNCGGFPKAFQNEELSEVGLIDTLARAEEIGWALREHYFEKHHTNCDVWALWSMARKPEQALAADADTPRR